VALGPPLGLPPAATTRVSVASAASRLSTLCAKTGYSTLTPIPPPWKPKQKDGLVLTSIVTNRSGLTLPRQ